MKRRSHPPASRPSDAGQQEQTPYAPPRGIGDDGQTASEGKHDAGRHPPAADSMRAGGSSGVADLPGTASSRPGRHVPTWFKIATGSLMLVSLLAVTTLAMVRLGGLEPVGFVDWLAHPVWQGISLLLVPCLIVYRMLKRNRFSWKIDTTSSGWANFFLWWGVIYYVLLGIQLVAHTLGR